MRRSVALITIGLIAGVPQAFAQNTISSPNLTAPPPQNQALPQAPVGHRQPRAGDVPGDPNQAQNSQAAIDRDDAALDRKIKGICKGC